MTEPRFCTEVPDQSCIGSSSHSEQNLTGDLWHDKSEVTLTLAQGWSAQDDGELTRDAFTPNVDGTIQLTVDADVTYSDPGRSSTVRLLIVWTDALNNQHTIASPAATVSDAEPQLHIELGGVLTNAKGTAFQLQHLSGFPTQSAEVLASWSIIASPHT